MAVDKGDFDHSMRAVRDALRSVEKSAREKNWILVKSALRRIEVSLRSIEDLLEEGSIWID